MRSNKENYVVMIVNMCKCQLIYFLSSKCSSRISSSGSLSGPNHSDGPFRKRIHYSGFDGKLWQILKKINLGLIQFIQKIMVFFLLEIGGTLYFGRVSFFPPTSQSQGQGFYHPRIHLYCWLQVRLMFCSN